MESLVKTKFFEMSLDNMLSQLGEDMTKKILSSFSCPNNKDVENFLRDKAILFSRNEIAKTYLVFWSSESSDFGSSSRELVGYYSISTKPLSIHRNALGSRMKSAKWREICRIANVKTKEEDCILSAHLIGQLGKNFSSGNNLLISGHELLNLALQKIYEAQKLIGGRIVYVECEDKEKLLSFYDKNDFQLVGKRMLDGDETDLNGSYLMQLYRCL